jgi:signal transduction histidine kinase/pSer/pThr/pTyr-binding forkhead associated (FHA) protein
VAILFVTKGADENKRFELEGVVTIGRDANNSCRLHDTEASRRHAELRPLPGGGHQLIDLGSSNGTFVNQQPIKEVTLQPGDQVQIGQTHLVYLAVKEGNSRGDLAEQINMISRANHEAPSAIRSSVSGGEGSRLLAHPDKAGGPWLKNALANLSVMYQVTQAVSHILDTDQLLDKIMDLIFETIHADRGCIMLRSGEGNVFSPKSVRYRSGVDQQEKITISRSIMEHVLREQQGVLVSDAAHDQRFRGSHSVHGYGIREALCVPMRGRHETLGVLYLDTQVKPQEATHGGNIFTDDHLMLAVAIGHHAALALEETRYYQAMVQAERLAAVGQTIAAISHHIKNILQGLRSGSEMVQMGLGEDDKQLLQHGANLVGKSQRRIHDLMMDMLSYSKEREPALEATDLVEVVHDVLEIVEARIKHAGITLEVRCDETLPPMLIDPEGLHRALLNVVSNALDALENSDNPQLSVQTLLEHSSQWVQIVVADNGCGIPAEKLADIFKPFVSTKGSRGTGLGLPVSRKILREHGGDIVVQSQPGKGSKFILRLPAQFQRSPDAQLTLRKTMLSEAPPGEE